MSIKTNTGIRLAPGRSLIADVADQGFRIGISHQIARSVIAFVVTIIAVSTSASLANPAAMSSENNEWRLLGNGHEQIFFSPLSQINDGNVNRLGLAWYADIPSRDGLVGNALVADGVVYQSGALNRVYANDVRTGKLLWAFDPQYNYSGGTMSTYLGGRINRGLALWEDKVLIATGDCRMIAVNRNTGAKVWETVSCDKTDEYTQTGAPRVGGGMVFTGNSCMDSGKVRGYVTAYDVNTGREKWRWFTVPGDPSEGYENEAMEMAAKTWGTNWRQNTHGCGQVWEVITYDPKLNLLYIGPGGVSPFSPAQRAPDAGDELFTNSIVALKADTGEYVWHYKLTPHDAWNLEPMPPMIVNLPINGQTRRVVLEAGKNGFFYVLDAKTGKFISANNFAPVNWAKGIDQKTGRPILNPEANWWEKPDGAVVYGAVVGLRNWNPMAYNPNTGLAYIPLQNVPTRVTSDPKDILGGALWEMINVDTKKWTQEGRLVAWDPLTQKARWSVQHEMPINGGVMTTAGNLVFQGTATGQLEARAANTGKLLWSGNVGGVAVAAPTTVEIDGEQIILVPSGNGGSSVTARAMPQFAVCKACRAPTRLLAFKLNGTAKLPKVNPEPPFPEPPRKPYPDALAKRGSVLYKREGCELCHGIETVSLRGSVPDLRRTPAERHNLFAEIVQGGLLKNLGMPEFGYLTEKDVQALQAYVINQAWKNYNIDRR